MKEFQNDVQKRKRNADNDELESKVDQRQN